MVSKGVPKMYQKSLKIHPGTFQGPSVCIRDPLDCKMVPKWCPRTSQMTQNGHPGTLKGAKNSTESTNQVYNKQIYGSCVYQLISILETSFSIPANPSVCKSAVN